MQIEYIDEITGGTIENEDEKKEYDELVRQITIIEKISNVINLQPEVKKKYIQYLRIVIRIHEMNGIRFRSEVDQQIYKKILISIRYLQKLKQQGRINEQQIVLLERQVYTIYKIEIFLRFNYTKAVRKYINKMKVIWCIYIEDEQIRKNYFGLLSQIKQIETQSNLQFKDHCQKMVYIRLLKELDNIEKYINSGMCEQTEEIQNRA